VLKDNKKNLGRQLKLPEVRQRQLKLPVAFKMLACPKGGVPMKKDAEVTIYMRERKKGKTQVQAAARAGMSEWTARKYEQAAKLPSQLKEPRQHRTRTNPFAEDWEWVVEQLERDSALQATTLFKVLMEKQPDRYQPVQVRTLQRQIAGWRAVHGADKVAMFEQVAIAAKVGQSDFTSMNDLRVTLAGQAFDHLVYHFVLVYSNVEAVRVCFSESFEALAEGLEAALWQIGGVPAEHRTDHLSAAVLENGADGKADFKERYKALMAHYGLIPTYNNQGQAHENGDVEQAHFRFKEAVDQALRVRGSRDFSDRKAYEQFLTELARQRNTTRAKRFALEQVALHPLPNQPLAPCRELKVTVSCFSTIQVLGNTYSVPSRLIGTKLKVLVRAEQVEGYVGITKVFSLPRLVGNKKHAINYRHLITSLVRKPGAFSQYRFREEFFPSTVFRRAYDHLQTKQPKTGDGEYLKVLHLAATTSESEVETALQLLLEGKTLPTFKAVQELVRPLIPSLSRFVPDLSRYDQLLHSQQGGAQYD
jgi:hypothetical protein